MNLNKDRVFYKIPLGLAYQGRPGATGSIKHRKLYAAYLYFKAINRFGTFTIQEAYGGNRDKANYWIKRLLKAGWVTKTGDRYSLKAYQEIWRLMGCEKFTKKRTGLSFYKYQKHDATTARGISDALRYLLDLIQTEYAAQFKRQVKFKLSNGDNSKKLTTQKLEFGVDKAAQLFGYASPASGSKYRGKYFKVEQRKGRRLCVHPLLGIVANLFYCGYVFV